MTLDVQHLRAQNEFIAVVNGLTSRLDYSLSSDGKTLDYQSTFVPEELRGQHIGEGIVKFALDFARKGNYKVIPTCPFVKKYIDRHPEYKDLIVI